MAETIKLTSKAEDGFKFAAYHEVPFTPRKGGVIVLQEIFGIDRHVRADVERWAKMGFEAVAPALFDRGQKDFHAEHTQEGIAEGVKHAMAISRDKVLGDIAACRDFLAERGPVYVVGYCYGGSFAWLSAAYIEGLSGASSYYGSMVQANAALPLKCPTIVHLGRTDPGIPADEVAAEIAKHHPKVPVYIYEGAGHGFNNESPERYNEEAADLARHRTLELFGGL